MDKKLESKRTKEARLWIIINDICKGFNNLSLTRKYKDDWKISQTTMMNLITEAYERMKIGDEEYLNELRQINIKRLEDIATTALDQGDTSSALKAIDHVNKTAGNIYSTKIELGGNTRFQYTFANDDEEVNNEENTETNKEETDNDD